MVWSLYLYTVFPAGRFIVKHRKTNDLTNLESKIKAKIRTVKRKRLLFKEAVCENNKSLIKLIVNQNLSLNFSLNKLGDVNCRTSRGKLFHNTLPL